MHHDETDQALVGDYAWIRSDAAFQALVRRHVNLVYATALRQIGNRGLAEEITQNTFVALARKAPGLTGHGTIAGWLHRTALLEAQRRIRTELRRRRRETTAAELQQLAAAGAEPLDDLGPFLDEALLQLGEGERTALVLRFFQDRRLAEVGAALGISEEAARKRVDRAVARLAGFLRSQGFPVAGATVSGLAGQAAVTAPTSLAASAAAAGLAAGTAQTALPGLTLLLGPLTPAKAVVFGALLAVATLAWQRHQLQAAGSVNPSL
ncbi:MAG: RNA polymerase sigma factor, partial [Verrucomicrobiota bacterium]